MKKKRSRGKERRLRSQSVQRSPPTSERSQRVLQRVFQKSAKTQRKMGEVQKGTEREQDQFFEVPPQFDQESIGNTRKKAERPGTSRSKSEEKVASGSAQSLQKAKKDGARGESATGTDHAKRRRSRGGLERDNEPLKSSNFSGSISVNNFES